jgi:hypothetical protein
MKSTLKRHLNRRPALASKSLLYRCVAIDRTIFSKTLRKLMGRTDMEDALMRLDRPAQEDARMAAAQVREVTNTVDDRGGFLITRL